MSKGNPIVRVRFPPEVDWLDATCRRLAVTSPFRKPPDRSELVRRAVREMRAHMERSRKPRKRKAEADDGDRTADDDGAERP